MWQPFFALGYKVDRNDALTRTFANERPRVAFSIVHQRESAGAMRIQPTQAYQGRAENASLKSLTLA
ncbi:hypothetical protein A3841_03005 [Pontibacter flavimaris]|uniref:Uncharacterized protein n=1 Tax=Pontibacter flavimaris TaxID=1797110 RepID=A0A1Q5P9R6_9BACT|nr:hypothetical protein A3841_03005 [Pontibacter flavimaris]